MKAGVVEMTPELNRIVDSWHAAKASDSVSLTTSEKLAYSNSQAHTGNV